MCGTASLQGYTDGMQIHPAYKLYLRVRSKLLQAIGKDENSYLVERILDYNASKKQV
jgi:hypothetical protein